MKKILVVVAGCQIIVAGYLLNTNFSFSINKSYAAEATSSITVNCIAPTPVAFIPSVVLAYSFDSKSSALTDADCSFASAELNDSVNGDMVPNISSCTRSRKDGISQIRIDYQTPVMKIAGLQCHNESSAEMKAFWKDNDEKTVNGIYLEAPNLKTPLRNIKNAITETGSSIYGTDGHLGQGVKDGYDADGKLNGEIAFGGATQETGGTKTVVLIDAFQNSGNAYVDMGFTLSII